MEVLIGPTAKMEVPRVDSKHRVAHKHMAVQVPVETVVMVPSFKEEIAPMFTLAAGGAAGTVVVAVPVKTTPTSVVPVDLLLSTT